MRIRPDEIHVWLAEPDALAWRGELAGCAALLSDAERDRAERFVHERDQRGYVAAHALTRAALSWCVPHVRPEVWQFTPGRYGRPEIAAPRLPRRLRVNLSHTDGLVGCVVTVGTDCGVDLEPVDRRLNLRRLARKVLAPTELVHVEATDGPEQRELFARYWTLKEAYVKARGLGMSVPLDRCAFTLWPTIRANVPDNPSGAAGCWRFDQWWPTHRHVAALAVRSAGYGRIVRHGWPVGAMSDLTTSSGSRHGAA